MTPAPVDAEATLALINDLYRQVVGLSAEVQRLRELVPADPTRGDPDDSDD